MLFPTRHGRHFCVVCGTNKTGSYELAHLAPFCLGTTAYTGGVHEDTRTIFKKTEKGRQVCRSCCGKIRSTSSSKDRKLNKNKEKRGFKDLARSEKMEKVRQVIPHLKQILENFFKDNLGVQHVNLGSLSTLLDDQGMQFKFVSKTCEDSDEEGDASFRVLPRSKVFAFPQNFDSDEVPASEGEDFDEKQHGKWNAAAAAAAAAGGDDDDDESPSDDENDNDYPPTPSDEENAGAAATAAAAAGGWWWW